MLIMVVVALVLYITISDRERLKLLVRIVEARSISLWQKLRVGQVLGPHQDASMLHNSARCFVPTAHVDLALDGRS